jgi:hypothetical protein
VERGDNDDREADPERVSTASIPSRVPRDASCAALARASRGERRARIARVDSRDDPGVRPEPRPWFRDVTGDPRSPNAHLLANVLALCASDMAVALHAGNRVAKTKQASNDATHRNAEDPMDIRANEARGGVLSSGRATANDGTRVKTSADRKCSSRRKDTHNITKKKTKKKKHDDDECPADYAYAPYGSTARQSDALIPV